MPASGGKPPRPPLTERQNRAFQAGLSGRIEPSRMSICVHHVPLGSRLDMGSTEDVASAAFTRGSRQGAEILLDNTALPVVAQ